MSFFLSTLIASLISSIYFYSLIFFALYDLHFVLNLLTSSAKSPIMSFRYISHCLTCYYCWLINSMHSKAPDTIFFVYFFWFLMIYYNLLKIYSEFCFFLVEGDLLKSSWFLFLENLFLGVEAPEMSNLFLFLIGFILWILKIGSWIDPLILSLDRSFFKLFWELDLFLLLFFDTKFSCIYWGYWCVRWVFL